ncbi:hypothetical protein CRM22_010698, partial [Opisthorchis felineus]
RVLCATVLVAIHALVDGQLLDPMLQYDLITKLSEEAIKEIPTTTENVFDRDTVAKWNEEYNKLTSSMALCLSKDEKCEESSKDQIKANGKKLTMEVYPSLMKGLKGLSE